MGSHRPNLELSWPIIYHVLVPDLAARGRNDARMDGALRPCGPATALLFWAQLAVGVFSENFRKRALSATARHGTAV